MFEETTSRIEPLDFFQSESQRRRPANTGMFLRPLILFKILLRRMEALTGKNCILGKFYEFSEFKILLISRKPLYSFGKKRHILELISFDRHLIANSLPLPILKKIQVSFQNSSSFFFQIWYVLRSFNISIAFYGKFAMTWWWKFFIVRTVQHRTFSHIGHFQIAKT